MAVVAPEERAAASGITGVARTLGAAISPLFAGLMFARPSRRHVFLHLEPGLIESPDIALAAGFSDLSHFNRLFRARFGDTPRGVRRTLKKDQRIPSTS
jgi:hypothetical protein